jgi:AI-2 transport protein TqsA
VTDQSEPTVQTKSPGGWWAEAGTLPRLAVFLIIFAASWFMLKELAALLRPLLMATLLCYIILPIHQKLHKSHSQIKTISIMAIGGLAILVLLGVLIYGSIIEFNDDLPRLTKRAQELSQIAQHWTTDNLPGPVSRSVNDALRVEAKGAQQLPDLGKSFVQYAADFLLEMLIVGLYVIFLLIEAKRLARRVESGFETEQANRIRETVETINKGIANYIRAKVLSSAILAVPVTVALLLFGVKPAILWGLLTFVCNFVPYVGSVVGAGSPIIFAFLDLPSGWQPLVAAIVIVVWHSTSAALIEPYLLGNAVGLSPLVILVSLTFWGLCWGLVGMFLAVPLTVTLKIVLSHIEAAQPIARLLGNE